MARIWTWSAHRELGDGVVDDVERVAADEVERDLDEERRAVDHRGLDDEHEHLGVAELRGHGAARLTGDKPNNRVPRS